MKAIEYFPDAQSATLAQAVATGQTEVIIKLLTEGYDVNTRGQDGVTLVMWAILNQNKSSYECLLQHGANPNMQISAGASELTTKLYLTGESATSLAAKLEDSWYLETTLKYGGNPNIVNPFRGFTPIYASIETQRIQQAERLINAGADFNYQNKDGITPPMFAAMSNQYKLVYDMIRIGSDVNIKDRWGTTIVYYINKSAGHTLPEMTKWRDKVIDLLRKRGVAGLNSGKQ